MYPKYCLGHCVRHNGRRMVYSSLLDSTRRTLQDRMLKHGCTTTIEHTRGMNVYDCLWGAKYPTQHWLYISICIFMGRVLTTASFGTKYIPYITLMQKLLNL